MEDSVQFRDISKKVGRFAKPFQKALREDGAEFLADFGSYRFGLDGQSSHGLGPSAQHFGITLEEAQQREKVFLRLLRHFINRKEREKKKS